MHITLSCCIFCVSLFYHKCLVSWPLQFDLAKTAKIKEDYKLGLFPGRNPENMDLRQYPLGPTDMQRWYRSFKKKEAYTGKVSMGGGS